MRGVNFAQSFPIFMSTMLVLFQSPAGKPHVLGDWLWPPSARLRRAPPSPICPEKKADLFPLLPSILPGFPSSYPSYSLGSYSVPSSKSNLMEPHLWVPPFLLSHPLSVQHFPLDGPCHKLRPSREAASV